MRILISGLFVFLIWAAFSSYIYVEKIWQEPVDPDTTLVEPVVEEIVLEEASDLSPAATPVLPSDFNVYFDYNKADIIADNQNDEKFKTFIDYLIFETESIVEITGHTDARGSAKYNDELGLIRANSVVLRFQELGINDARLSINSKGESSPVANNTTEEGRANNRRTEIKIKN